MPQCHAAYPTWSVLEGNKMGGEGHSRVHTSLALSGHTGARMAGNLPGDLVSMVREWFSGRTPEI